MIERALIIKEKWLNMIFDGSKTWEIRSRNTKVYGRIGLIQSASGMIHGECDIVDSYPLNEIVFANQRTKHRIMEGRMPYPDTYAWVIKNAKRYDNPIPYTHPQGAVIWVRLDGLMPVERN